MRTKAKHSLSPAEQLYVSLPADASATELALATVALWDEEDARKKGYSEKVADAQAAAERKKAKVAILAAILKPQSAKTHAAPDVLIRCSAFDTTDKRAPRKTDVNKEFPVYAGGVVKLESPVELRQDDKRVLFALVHTCANVAPDAKAFNVRPGALLRELGWSDSGTSKKKHNDGHDDKVRSMSSKDRLQACIERLIGPTLAYYLPGVDPKTGLAEWKTTLVAAATFEGAEWRIELPSSVAKMWLGRATKLSIEIQAKIAVGFPSWLADFLCSHDGDKSFELDVLQMHSGRTEMPRFAFKRKMRFALEQIKEAGAISHYGWHGTELYFAKPVKKSVQQKPRL
jgi:hypothetical protein